METFFATITTDQWIKIMETIAWPATVVLMLFLFRYQFERLFERAKKIELPGGISVETFQEEIRVAADLAIEISENEPVRKSGNESFKTISKNPKERLVEMKVQLRKKLKAMAENADVDVLQMDTVESLCDKLSIKEYLSYDKKRLIHHFIKISDGALEGHKIENDHVDQLEKSLLSTNLL